MTEFFGLSAGTRILTPNPLSKDGEGASNSPSPYLGKGPGDGEDKVKSKPYHSSSDSKTPFGYGFRQEVSQIKSDHHNLEEVLTRASIPFQVLEMWIQLEFPVRLF